MEKEFVPYELALRMKKLKSIDKGFRHGFNEKTSAYFIEGFPDKKLTISNKPKRYSYEYNGGGPELISAPLYQQAFRWFREKYNIHIRIEKYDETKWWANWGSWTSEVYDSYEEAERACLEKLIEIVKQKEKENE
jgi:hypothetical protein